MIRHADAGDSATWPGDDSVRPLSVKGERQAQKIAESKELQSVTELISSPSLRCRQTVEPLSSRVHLPIELEEWLVTGASALIALDALVERASGLDEDDELVACTHGDLIEGFVAEMSQRGVPFESEPIVSKGAVVVIELRDGAPSRVAFRPPPKVRSRASR